MEEEDWAFWMFIRAHRAAAVVIVCLYGYAFFC